MYECYYEINTDILHSSCCHCHVIFSCGLMDLHFRISPVVVSHPVLFTWMLWIWTYSISLCSSKRSMRSIQLTKWLNELDSVIRTVSYWSNYVTRRKSHRQEPNSRTGKFQLKLSLNISKGQLCQISLTKLSPDCWESPHILLKFTQMCSHTLPHKTATDKELLWAVEGTVISVYIPPVWLHNQTSSVLHK